MKNLLIIGALASGRETYNLAIQCKGYLEEFRIKGFLDDRVNVLDEYKGYPQIISSVVDYEIQQDDVFVCALVNVDYKKSYVDIILAKGGEFISLVHPTVNILQNVEIGQGCIIGYGAYLSCDLKIGNFVTISPYSIIGHDAVIGDWCQLEAYSFIGGFVRLCPMVTIHTGGIILNTKIVESHSIVGAGSVVISNVKENITVIGIPAKKLEF